jgi:undecaprenyl-diphosphatase
LDEHLFRLVYGALGGSLTSVAAAFTFLGEGWVVLLLLPLLFVPRHRAATLTLIIVLGITAATVAGLKLLVHRVRPCNAMTSVRCLWGDTPSDFSFPSGHAAGSFAFAAFAMGIVFVSAQPTESRRPKLLAAGALVVAFCISLSRVYLGVHFPGDVLGGSCLGAAIGLVGARLHLRRGRREEYDAPSPTPSRRSIQTRT